MDMTTKGSKIILTQEMNTISMKKNRNNHIRTTNMNLFFN